MKIAIVASEAVPFAKTGGLADVAGALPKALFRLGHEPILIMPLHRAVRRAGTDLAEAGKIVVPVGKRQVESRLWRGEIPGIDAPAYFLEQNEYFDRDGVYGYNDDEYADNCERFAFLARGAVQAVRTLGFDADVFHIHDWQSALVAPYLRLLYAADPLAAPLRRAPDDPQHGAPGDLLALGHGTDRGGLVRTSTCASSSSGGRSTC